MSSSLSIKELLERAESLFRDGRDRDCREVLVQVLRRKPEVAQAHRAVGLLLVVHRRLAESEARQAADSYPDLDQVERWLRERTVAHSGRPLGVTAVGCLGLVVWGLGLLMGLSMIPAVPTMDWIQLRTYFLVLAVVVVGMAASYFFLRGATWAYGLTVVFYLVLLFDGIWGARSALPRLVSVLLSGAVLVYLMGHKLVRAHFRV